MADELTSTNRPRRYGKGRLEAFSDGVFAIAITLLVLDLSVPAAEGDRLLVGILEEWPMYLAYFVSFATIGGAWIAHSTITEYLHGTDRWFVRLNLLLLLVVSFLPFPTRLTAEYQGQEEAQRVAVTLYGLTLLMLMLLVSILWRYAVREKLVRPDADDEEIQVLTKRLTPGLIGYAALITFGLFVPTLAFVGYLAIAIYLIVPFGLIRHRHH